jgi:phenylacetate-coenzyme A ligase PaaK-like adenylate-forming protein
LAYQIVNVGKVFSEKTRQALTEQLNAQEQQGWEFHSVFGVTERTGCLGGSTSETLYMVLKARN